MGGHMLGAAYKEWMCFIVKSKKQKCSVSVSFPALEGCLFKLQASHIAPSAVSQKTNIRVTGRN